MCHARVSLKLPWNVLKLTMTPWLLLMSTGVLRSLFESKGVLLAKLLEAGCRLESEEGPESGASVCCCYFAEGGEG